MEVLYFMSPSQDPWYNLALDEYFLREIKGNHILLYLYVNQPSVIIGRNQNAWKECNVAAMEEDGVKLVRRITGGGAVYHDTGNLNFSFHADHNNYDLDKQITTILETVKSLGIEAEFSGRNDLTIAGRKFSGNAFGIHGENQLHHGTLLIHSDLSKLAQYLNVSEQKIKSKGIESIRTRVCNLEEHAAGLRTETVVKALRKTFELYYGECIPMTLDEHARNETDALFDKQSSWEWRFGNSMDFEYETDTRFDWGEIQLCFHVVDGRIQDLKVYTDSLLVDLPDTVRGMLVGRRFNSEDMSKSLNEGSNTQIIRDLSGHIASLKL